MEETALRPVIHVVRERCVNCHRCIMVCPVKMCNDGRGEVIEHHSDLCIGCGECIAVCTHQARLGIDDMDAFMGGLKNGESIVAIVAPAAAASFGGKYRELNGFLKHLGVKAVFDVSFGAELTVKSYLDYIQKQNPSVVIAQPCPTIVSFIEMYRPELIPCLAPVDSPMTHMMKMIKKYYPQYADCKIAAISPCYSKRREFDACGIGDYNITFKSLQRCLDERGESIGAYPATDYDNPPAERAVLFSSPGGLMRTIQRYNPEINSNTRKIEGAPEVYHYFAYLGKAINDNMVPDFWLVDCLNCELGCNGGPGTLNQGRHLDELEFLVEKRSREMREQYKSNGAPDMEKLEATLSTYWEDGLYNRSYTDRSSIFRKMVIAPTDEQVQETFVKMHKTEEKDLFNCGACGYKSCEQMAVAIVNGLNKPENCRHFVEVENLQRAMTALKVERDEIAAMKDNLKAGIFLMDKDFIIQDHYSKALEEVLAASELYKRKFTDLMEDSMDAPAIEFLKSYFRQIMNRSLTQEQLDRNNPLRELHYISTEMPVKKTLRCEFAPIERENGDMFILGTIEDITAEANLRKKLEDEERKRQREMRSFFEVLHVEPWMFSYFIGDVECHFDEVAAILKNKDLSDQEAVRAIYPLIRSVETDSLVLGLQSFGEKLWDMKVRLKQMRGQTAISFREMLELALLFESILQEKDTLIKNVETVRAHRTDEDHDHDEYVLTEFLAKVCNGAAARLDKKVLFSVEAVEGKALRKTSRQSVKEALTQLVYNAVSHGIEPSAERLALGKPAIGVIRLSIKLEGNAIRIKLSDDGKGIDFERVRKKALERGILKETDGTPDKTALVRAMFAPGFSNVASGVSLDEGQDFGLGRVHSRVREMKGSIKVQSQEGKGTAFIIDIPLTAAQNSAA